MSTVSETRTSAPQANIERKLEKAWKRECAFSHLRGLGWMIPWLIGIFLVDLVLDWSLDLPGAVRLGLLAINVGLIGWLLYRHWLSYLRAYDATRVSLQVEKLHPGLNSMIVSYVQFDGSNKVHGAPWMIEGLRRQAVEATAPLDFSGIVDFSKLRRLLAIAGGVLGLFLVSSLFLGTFYLILVGRMLLPFSDLAYPTRTKIETVKGPAAVRQGDEVDLEARAGGIVPEDGSIFLKVGEGPWESASIARGDESDFRYHLPKLNQTLSYYYRIGDARSPKHEVKVVPPPRMVSAIVHVQFPAYTGRTPQHVKLSEMRGVPEGSAVTWEIALDQPIQSGKLVFDRAANEPRLEYAVVPDAENPKLVRVRVPDVDAIVPPASDRLVAASAPYHFEWTEKEHGFSFKDATRHLLEVIPDRPPTITVYEPVSRGENDKALATKYLTQDFEYSVVDDYGPGKARIAYRVNDGPEAFVNLGKIPKVGARELIVTKWRVGQWYADLKEGDVVTFAVEVTDNRDTRAGPNVVRSPAFRVNIVDPKEYQAYIDRRRAQGLEQTTQAAGQVSQSQKKLNSLAPEKAP